MTPGPVVDACAVHFDPDSWAAYLRTFAAVAPGYLRHFARPLTATAGLDTDRFLAVLQDDPDAAVTWLLGGAPLSPPIDEHARALREDGVVHQVLHGLPHRLSDGETVNDRVAAAVRRHPDLLSGWAGISLADPDAAVAELARCQDQLQLTGASIIPFLDAVRPTDPGCAPVFAACEARRLPVWLHCGQSFRTDVPLDLCGWREVDALAGRHPDLTIVVGHGGWPFVGELVAVMHRHPNVLLELSSHTGASILAAGSGWEPLLLHGRQGLRSRILFGSVSWVTGRSPRSLADDLAVAAGDEAVARRWLHDNAARRLGVRTTDVVPR